jgi:hypothetical protein
VQIPLDAAVPAGAMALNSQPACKRCIAGAVSAYFVIGFDVRMDCDAAGGECDSPVPCLQEHHQHAL